MFYLPLSLCNFISLLIFFIPSSTILLFSLLNFFIASSTIFIIFPPPPHFYYFPPPPPPPHFYYFPTLTFTPIAKNFMLYCRLIYMLSILCVRLTIKVKVGIPGSFKVGSYPPKKLGRVTLIDGPKTGLKLLDGQV